MKLRKIYYIFMGLPMVLASCADYLDTDNYYVEQPADDARLAYLNEYKPIKEYVNRSAHPGFTLGTGVSAEDYIKQGAAYMLTNSNFDMVTAGNAMKYASIVDDKGNMNFGTVSSFVEAATNAGMQVYGHTLVWHSQQNTKYLNGLIADKQLPADPSQTHEEYVARECIQVLTDDMVSDPWDSQFWLNFP
ncbi:MAG: endo-1,4-beta-xylanase, partial [Muribaculaceae bacterium]|nr:endo-1,4-beta-xylanase [Muribaculaceae bacterium]